jgi:adenylosuccinate lyase
VEIEYFIALTTFLKVFDVESIASKLRAIYQDFNEIDAQRVKDIEKVTNHDVKAVEYFIKEKFDEIGGLEAYKEFIHFGLTSQDINNTSVPLSIKEALEEVYYPMIEELIAQLQEYADAWKDIPMLAKTHGQPASPTRLGKEVMVYVYRLTEQLQALKGCKLTAKFGGATGNYNAHHVAYPQVDWKAFGNQFVSEQLGLEREQWTTQISNYDHLGAVFNAMARINTIMIDLDRDFWMYVSMEYFKQKIKAGEVGSSAMPHKVNPIDFENSEGNLGIANAILAHLANKLPVSRLQRDLTDSTVLRNVGVPMGHMVIAIQSTLKGLRKLLINEAAIQRDLDNCWAVCAEGIQTILRREGYPHPYEALKALTRTNNAITAQSIHDFIDGLDVSECVKAELRQITPSTYFGM